MDLWVWIVAYLVGFALLQLLVYRYVRENVQREETTTPRSSRARAVPPQPDGGPAGDGDVVCRHCGTANEQDSAYTFCRRCVTPLSGPE